MKAGRQVKGVIQIEQQAEHTQRLLSCCRCSDNTKIPSPTATATLVYKPSAAWHGGGSWGVQHSVQCQLTILVPDMAPCMTKSPHHTAAPASVAISTSSHLQCNAPWPLNHSQNSTSQTTARILLPPPTGRTCAALSWRPACSNCPANPSTWLRPRPSSCRACSAPPRRPMLVVAARSGMKQEGPCSGNQRLGAGRLDGGGGGGGETRHACEQLGGK